MVSLFFKWGVFPEVRCQRAYQRPATIAAARRLAESDTATNMPRLDGDGVTKSMTPREAVRPSVAMTGNGEGSDSFTSGKIPGAFIV
jgi:hypothetical protein